MTNSNTSTKENLTNIFGSKALLSLIPLNLQFEMNPSNHSNSTQSVKVLNTQEDGSRAVEILGHISRPVVGEGRGLPDRQMFFVNSRPCNLPQVKKAFNEVYRSYNISQSPFVFANIKLDTNAYDVNVSPDKRTIMLHDQAALLESLRDSLAELFEGHDQSVPQAQLLGKRTLSASTPKPPLVQQRSSTIFDLEELPAPTPIPESRKLSSTHVERSESPAISKDAPLPGFVKASLIGQFAERELEERVVHPLPGRKRRLASFQEDTTEPSAIESNTEREGASSEANEPVKELQQREESPLFEPECDASPPAVAVQPRSRIVEDFNARILSQQEKHSAAKLLPRIEEPKDEPTEHKEQIPAIIQTPQRMTQSTIQNAFDRMRPMRTPLQQATITVGNTTTVSTIGSGSESRASKRARVHTPKYSLNGSPLSQKPKQLNFLKGLRGFAAPGTQIEDSDEDDESERDAALPNISGRSPSPQKRIGLQESEPPRTDEVDVSSNVLPDAPISDNESDVDEEPEAAPNVGKDDSDDDFIDDSEKKAREEAKIAKMIEEAEEAAARPTEENLKRATKLFKISQKKYSTTNLEQVVRIEARSITTRLRNLNAALREAESVAAERSSLADTQLNSEDPEERLSLIVTKSDFNLMRIIGQFNLGFILAVRPPTPSSPSAELFIIDQHASDEKYNFERFSATTVLVSQRLVHPHPLELTAVEQELILSNTPSLTANGFVVERSSPAPEDDEIDAHPRFSLTSLPMSKEVTFTPLDLSELLALIMDNPPSSSLTTSQHIPRPSKIRKLLASRACRSSVMIGKTLKVGKMEEIVKHMGSMDKPWSCPHGRPTMRHLYGLEKWQGWKEGDGITGLGEVGMQVDWGSYLKRSSEE